MGRRLEAEKVSQLGRAPEPFIRDHYLRRAEAMDEIEMRWPNPELRLAYHADLLDTAEEVVKDIERRIGNGSMEPRQVPDWFERLVLRVRAHRRERK